MPTIKQMQWLTMVKEMCGHIFVVSKAGPHERSPPIIVLHFCICTCSQWNATDDTTKHPLHIHCYSYKEDIKRHTVLSTVSQSTTHQSLYTYISYKCTTKQYTLKLHCPIRSRVQFHALFYGAHHQ